MTVLIVNWNRREDISRLLDDLRQQTEPPNEIIVVDNGSIDGAPDAIERDFPEVRLIRLHRNMGLSFGRNVGIAAAKSESITILDNDLRVLDRTFLAKIRQSLDDHRDCGVISFACLQGLWTQRPPSFPNRVYTLDELSAMASTGQAPVKSRSFYDWFFWGGACVVRSEVFKTVGLFDDVFNYGGEEWDFAYRCHEADIRLMRDEQLWVVHARSPQMRSKEGTGLILRNMVIAQSRYMPWPDLLLFLTMQFAKSALDALTGRSVIMFVSTCWQVLRNWRAQVVCKRRAVSRATMRRIYYLRMHSPSDYAAVERATINGIDFYWNQARSHKTRQSDASSYVLMI